LTSNRDKKSVPDFYVASFYRLMDSTEGKNGRSFPLLYHLPDPVRNIIGIMMSVFVASLHSSYPCAQKQPETLPGQGDSEQPPGEQLVLAEHGLHRAVEQGAVPRCQSRRNCCNLRCLHFELR